MSDLPRTRYARTSDGVHIAYQVWGDGPVDVVMIPGFISHLDLAWDLHTGEMLTRGDDVAGVAVHVAARVAGEAAADEVLASRTTVDLVAGSALGFTGGASMNSRVSTAAGPSSRSAREFAGRRSAPEWEHQYRQPQTPAA